VAEAARAVKLGKFQKKIATAYIALHCLPVLVYFCSGVEEWLSLELQPITLKQSNLRCTFHDLSKMSGFRTVGFRVEL
jgi:hypothetical protein